jgi:hypothetical protein
VAYFVEKENEMTQEQKKLLQDLAIVCGFKATSDLPQWMTTAEREDLRAYLETDPEITQTGRYAFQLDNRLVDFSPAVALPEFPRGFNAVSAAFLGWLGSFPFVLRIFKMLDDKKLRERRASL